MLLALLCVVSEWLRNWDPTPKSLHRLGGEARRGRALRANACGRATRHGPTWQSPACAGLKASTQTTGAVNLSWPLISYLQPVARTGLKASTQTIGAVNLGSDPNFPPPACGEKRVVQEIGLRPQFHGPWASAVTSMPPKGCCGSQPAAGPVNFQQQRHHGEESASRQCGLCLAQLSERNWPADPVEYALAAIAFDDAGVLARDIGV